MVHTSFVLMRVTVQCRCCVVTDHYPYLPQVPIASPLQARFRWIFSALFRPIKVYLARV